MDKRNSENFIMLPTVDFCFKELMQNPKVRQGFIAAIMGKDPKAIRKTTLIPNSTKKESKDAKLGILDVMVEMEDGSKINMEMQVAYFGYWSSRVLFYVSKTYSGQIKEGEDYDVLKKCIHVSVLDFIHFPQDKKCYRKIAFCDVETGEQYTDLMELHIPGIRMKRESSAGCAFSSGRTERSSKIWQRQTSILKRRMMN